ncbi:hypothetical protein Vretimale_1992 [Volvox reticuliferus]|uniref:Uncharacterized protein n=1 Tax=Volvox reticuliferus TaxID=1737510 RepID=A0A8J4D6L3_9CHLO|nr:hypothetical protein Vretifemale_4257 [Volvox reticuliferus]GIL96113.1 hypothetical protein Vretimale_1992 [Volvox reticuliferus]
MSGLTSHRQPTSLRSGNLHNRSGQQQQQQGAMDLQSQPDIPAPGSPTSSSSPRSPLIPPILLEATTAKLLVPSRQLLYALLTAPLLVWLVAVLAGIVHSEPIPEGVSKREFVHPVTWFDKYVFRVYGPLLPLAPYLIRVASLGLRASTPVPSPSGSQPLRRRLQPGATLVLPALLAYLTIALVRIGVYICHLGLQRWTGGLLVLVSDHLLLAASVVACFQSELVMCTSDAYKALLVRCSDRCMKLRLLAMFISVLITTILLILVCVDMYCTARWFHQPKESGLALLAGAVMFQLPVVMWLLLSSVTVATRFT